MDCRTALEMLEVARPGSGDLADPELAEAAAHVESHADCRNEFLRRQQLDREIGAVMRDVPVPHDLKSRLLAELAECPQSSDAAAAADTVAVAAPAADSKTALQRRTWLRLVGGAAACVAAGVIAWRFLPGDPPQIDIAGMPNRVAKLIADGNLNFENLKEFDGSYAQKWPDDWKFSGLTHAGPKSYRQADLTIAMHQFRFAHGNTPVTGYLLILPKKLVNPVPIKTSPAAAARGSMTSLSWTEGEFVYVCVVPGRGDHIGELVRRLRPHRIM